MGTPNHVSVIHCHRQVVPHSGLELLDVANGVPTGATLKYKSVSYVNKVFKMIRQMLVTMLHSLGCEADHLFYIVSKHLVTPESRSRP